MRLAEIDRSKDVWAYNPSQHKNLWRGLPRVVCLGPKSQMILREHWPESPEAFVFSPRTSRGSSRFSERYDSYGYRQAIDYGIMKAKVPRWTPHRLRHAHATEIRRLYGLEASRVAEGHATIDATELYAELDFGVAVKIARETG